jgi:hypothetical protein
LITAVRTVPEDLPVLLCTGFREPLPEGPAERLGIDEIAIKPIRRSEIAGAVTWLLEN